MIAKKQQPPDFINKNAIKILNIRFGSTTHQATEEKK